jgi:hypothetical protein
MMLRICVPLIIRYLSNIFVVDYPKTPFRKERIDQYIIKEKIFWGTKRDMVLKSKHRIIMLLSAWEKGVESKQDLALILTCPLL